MNNNSTKIYFICILLFVTGITASLILYYTISNSNELKRDKILSVTYGAVHNRITQEIDRNLNSLFALRADYIAHNGFTRSEFNKYASYYSSNINSIQALEWVPSIKLEQRDSFELATRLEGFKDFEITTRNGDSLVRAEDRPQYYPVNFIEPFQGNELAMGYDPGSSSIVRQNAIDSAIINHTAAASSIITIIQKSDPHKGILVFVPVFGSDEKTVIGFIEGVYLMKNLIKTALNKMDIHDNIQIYIKSKDANEELLFGKESNVKLTENNSRSGLIFLANKSWELQVILLNNNDISIIEPFWIMIAVVLLTILIVKIAFDALTDNRKILKENVKELIQKNQDLEQYAYVASHDLQEPLHTLQGLVNLIDKEYRDKLDDKGHQYLKYIHETSDRMSLLITNLLNYSRIGKMEAMELLNCAQLLDNVEFDLKKLITQSNAEIIRESELPIIKVYPIALQQVFRNLISNAIKFQNVGNKPIIKISAEIKNGQYQFLFEDNGIGIPAESLEHIFIIFKRLHTNTLYPGTGVGLANCKKIIDLHDGNIWAESKLGEGSKFFFTINLN
jgi:signal transduction histidine kinase